MAAAVAGKWYLQEGAGGTPADNGGYYAILRKEHTWR
jgi:hypothetical protein